MSLERGARIAHYEILDLLGRGGMGEVYRATDTKLNRDVALKLLPDQFTSDSDRMERFQREAKLLASLNHSNIAAIYGIEESDRTRALVIELVGGPTLADRIAQGPMPVVEVLTIAKQIAEAIEYAHEKGIIHRDLKPANIKLTSDGQVKVLDFGLAKAMSDEARFAANSNSPTLSLAATQAGIILGTASYMSPEQAKGKAVDRRADIWAFGVVVYEMLTSRLMYAGETASETMAQVMMTDPDWNALPADTPPGFRHLLRRCLTKDPRRRMRDIGEVRIAIEELIANPQPQATQPEAAPTRSGSRALPWVVAALALAVAGAAVWSSFRVKPLPQSTIRLTSELGGDVTLTLGTGAAAFLSPDGKMIAFIASKPPNQMAQIYVRRLDQLQPNPLSSTTGARNAFFSPDGQWIGFFADGKLKKVSVTGGAAVTLCDAEDDRGGTWLDADSIVFTPNTRSVLMKVSSAGGKPQPLTKFMEGEITHRWPHALPGRQAVLFVGSLTSNNYETANIEVHSLRTGETKVVQRGGYYPQYSTNGYLLYVHEATLFALPFDSNKLDVNGQPVPALEGVLSTPINGAAQFNVAANGTLVHLAGASVIPGIAIDFLTRDGKTRPLRPTLAGYFNLMFSPDGRRLAFEMTDQQYDIWVYEWERDTMTRLTFDPAQDRRPVWTPDGRRIVFSSQRADKATFNLYWVRADGTGEPQRLTESKNAQFPTSWHPSGKFLAYYELRPQTADLMILPMEGDEASGWKPGQPTAFLATPFSESEAIFSPDGRWIAYQSDESGKREVYVRPFPGPGGKWQVSTNGGMVPKWSKTGKELFFETLDNKIMFATYKVEGDSFRSDKPQLLSDIITVADRGGLPAFDLHPDGQRLAVFTRPESQLLGKLDKVTFVFNFADELRKIVPVK
jgi:serine/threonine-protein kinase